MSKPEKVCYLHIGTHKTGSTSIQHFLTDSIDGLESRGLICPIFAKGKINRDHKRLAYALGRFHHHHGDCEILSRLAGRLRREKKDIIISAETLSEKLSRSGALESVKNYFGDLGYRLHVIVYLRDQASYMNSRYVQEVKRFRMGGSFLGYLESTMEDPASSYDYWTHYQAFINDPDICFDPRSFAQASKVGLLKDFISLIPALADGSLLESYRLPPSANPNAGTRSVFVARLVTNSVEGDLPDGIAEQWALALRKHFMDHKWYQEPFVGLDDTLAKVIAGRFANGNNLLARKYWGCDWAELNPSTRWERKVFDFAEASPEERREVIRLAAKLMKLAHTPELKSGKDVAARPRPPKSRNKRPKRGIFSGILRFLGHSKKRKLKR